MLLIILGTRRSLNSTPVPPARPPARLPATPLAHPAAAGLLGIRQGLRLPPALGMDPAGLSPEQLAAAGIQRLPATLGEAMEAMEADTGLWGSSGGRGGAGVWAAPCVWMCAAVQLSPSPPPRQCLSRRFFPPAAELRHELDTAFGSEVLVRAFLAVRRSEWEWSMTLQPEEEVAALLTRY